MLAVSAEAGKIGRPAEALVTGEVVEQGRGAKILVFHYKRKKQYKKLRGHRQEYSAVRITEIAFDGQSFKAPELPKKEKKVKKAAEAQRSTKRRSGKEEDSWEESGEESGERRSRGARVRRSPDVAKKNGSAQHLDSVTSHDRLDLLRTDATRNWELILWRIKKDKALHETAATRTRSGLASRHLAGKLSPAEPSSSGSAARA